LTGGDVSDPAVEAVADGLAVGDESLEGRVPGMAARD
jgi:hypothetical protein